MIRLLLVSLGNFSPVEHALYKKPVPDFIWRGMLAPTVSRSVYAQLVAVMFPMVDKSHVLQNMPFSLKPKQCNGICNSRRVRDVVCEDHRRQCKVKPGTVYMGQQPHAVVESVAPLS